MPWLLFLAALGAWLLWCRLRTPPRKRAARERPPATKYHSVTIVAGPLACRRARVLARRDCALLPSHAPSLPLPECDAAECRCRYAHHSDRRRRIRRAVERGWPSRMQVQVERRRRPGRRSEDQLSGSYPP